MSRRFEVPGEGVEPSRPQWGQLILSQPRISNFATPAVEQGSGRYVPGWFADLGMPSTLLPMNASRNVVNACSLNVGHTATCAVPR
jgi:hypothetical protein